MCESDVRSLITAISNHLDLEKPLLMSGIKYFKIEDGRVYIIFNSESVPTDPELKIIYTQHKDNTSDEPVGHWFISVCDAQGQHHDIDSRDLETQKDSISCGLHTALNLILAKQELLKIASEPNGSSLSFNEICDRINKKVIGFNNSFRIDDFYQANINIGNEMDFDDLGSLLASCIKDFNAESEVSAKSQQESADSEYVAKLQQELADSEYMAKLQQELTDSEYAAKLQQESADSEHAAKLQQEECDKKLALELQAEVDNL